MLRNIYKRRKRKVQSTAIEKITLVKEMIKEIETLIKKKTEEAGPLNTTNQEIGIGLNKIETLISKMDIKNKQVPSKVNLYPKIEKSPIPEQLF
ncbi:hypothetical protein F8M41_019326 [Gigaspora margarita]|uniref:Uncharacterized protein n=1 Tax=Gigaspora margarita TaxID=4874 RepID=A0A8H4AK16_GIGMA|nr:hypothetical protein F8M41_019326 [Gigaspora margarita]